MKPKTPKRPGLGAALATSLQGERQSIDSRFRRAETLFQEKEKTDPSLSKPAETEPKATPKKLPPAEKVKRDTFTFPPSDYRRIQEIQKDCLQSAIQVNKSEVVRAGLIALQELPAKKRHELLQSVEKMKPGRPGS